MAELHNFQSAATMKKRLCDIHVCDCVKVKDCPILEVEAETPLVTCIDLMASNGISAMPLYTVTEDEGKKRYIGFIDQLDIICFINATLQKENYLQLLTHAISSTSAMKVFTAARALSHMNESSALTTSSFISVMPHASVLDTVFPLLKAGLSRVPVVGETGQVTQILPKAAS